MKQPRFLASVVLCTLAACSANSYRDSADREVYEILQKRRAEVLANPGAFSIEQSKDSLRARLAESMPASRPALKINLVTALQIAAENSRNYQAEKEQVYLSALDVTIERYRLGFIPSLRGDATVTGKAEEATEASGTLSPSLSKVLGTGARIVSTLGIGIFKSLLSNDGFRSLPSSLSLAITQPLLRGAGAAIVEESLTQAERNVIYSIRGFERFRHEFAVDVASRIYQILQDQDTVQNEKVNYENTKRVRERNEAHAQAGRLSEVEVGQARQNELSARNRWVNAEQNLAAGVDNFKIFLGLPAETQLEFDTTELEKLQKEGLAAVDVIENSAFQVALENRHDYKTSQDRVADAERRVKVAADALSAGIDFVFNYNVASPTGVATKFDFKNATWAAGFELDLPVDRLPQRNSYRTSLIALESEMRAASLATDNVRLQIRAALRDIAQARESYEIQKLAVDLADSRVRSSEMFLQAGRANTRDVLEAQEALLSARNALTRNLVDYNLAKLALYRDVGALILDENGISVNTTILQAARTARAAAPPSNSSGI